MNEINFQIEDIKKIELSMDVGVKEIFPPIENLEVTPTKEKQIFTNENSYGYDEVVVAPIPDTQEDLTEELNTYNTELTEQETIINNIIEALKNKTSNKEVE